MASTRAWEAFCASLFRQNQFAIRYDVEAMEEAVALEDLARVATRVVVVGGTNGKGTVASAIHAMALSAGLRTGLYTSPHLIDFRERIRLQGAPVSREALLTVGEAIMKRYAGRESTPRTPRALSYFELTTLMALRLFREAELDLAILEVGMGGRLDAVRAVESDVVALTGVSLDHQRFLGTDLQSIAREKAGVVRERTAHVLLHAAAPGTPELGRALHEGGRAFELVPGSPSAPPRKRNLELAAAVFRRLYGSSLPPEQIMAAVGSAARRMRWPGRQQAIEHEEGLLLVDGAHNVEAVSACVQWLAGLGFGPERSLDALVALGEERDPSEVLGPLMPMLGRVICTTSTSGPLRAPGALRDVLADAFPSAALEEAPDVAAGLSAREKGEPLLIVGSLYLVGDTLAHLGFDAESLQVWDPEA